MKRQARVISSRSTSKTAGGKTARVLRSSGWSVTAPKAKNPIQPQPLPGLDRARREVEKRGQ